MKNKECNKLFNLEEEIKLILENSEKSREDDMYLYFTYVVNKNPTLDFSRVFFDSKYRAYHDIKTFGAVERCGREIRRNNPSLNGKNQKIRLEEQQTYIDYNFISKMAII